MSYLDNLTATLSPTISLVLCLKTLAICSFAYFLLCTLNYITFDPRAKLPGPKLRGAFQLPDYWSVITGKHYRQWNALHEKYGEVVRMSPDLVSFINPEAWREIYGFGNTTPLAKDPHFYFRPPSDIASANDADHARIRRPLNHAFSEQALRSQESMINSYIILLTKKLHRRAVEKTPVDLVQWLNFTTFDITGDLTFGESFGALDQETYNFWMANLFNAFRFASILGVIKRLPVIGKLSIALLKSIPALSQAEHQHNTYTEKKIAKRLATETDRKDFVSYILKNKGAITNYELEQTSGTLIVGGSETIATLLSGVFYYLQRNPQWMDKLHNEIRTAFASESDINFAALSQLKVLNAIIYETFRMYPPVPAALPRIVPKEGATICGRWLPAGTRVGVPQYAMYHSSRYFTNPEVYAPERFLGAKEYENDQRNVIQPFSVGPRNCIGQSLAWAEARAIIARLVWNFEFELVDKQVKWENQRVFVLWEKPELMVRLKAREGVM